MMRRGMHVAMRHPEEVLMAQFGLDLPTTDAAAFDKAYFGYVGRELTSRPEVLSKLVSYPVNLLIERRVVSMSCGSHLDKFLKQWRSEQV